MIVETKNNRQVFVCRLGTSDLNSLYDYLQNLSPETKKRFGPHEFDRQSIIDFYERSETHLGYIARDLETQRIIAYSIIKIGFLENDDIRFQAYGMTLNRTTDCIFAPSVADLWQSCGIGNMLFQLILSDLKKMGIKRIILWGGVQMDNDKAINYYKKNDFKTIGCFTHNGENYDMFFDIPQIHSC